MYKEFIQLFEFNGRQETLSLPLFILNQRLLLRNDRSFLYRAPACNKCLLCLLRPFQNELECLRNTKPQTQCRVHKGARYVFSSVVVMVSTMFTTVGLPASSHQQITHWQFVPCDPTNTGHSRESIGSAEVLLHGLQIMTGCEIVIHCNEYH